MRPLSYLSFLLSISLFFGTASFALAAEEIAQSPEVERASQEVKDSVDALVSARDENVANDLALRINAFEKVVELSLSELKDFKVKLLLVDTDGDEDIALWKDYVLAQLDEAEKYFKAHEKSDFSDIEDVDEVKGLAGAFKKWREANYIPYTQQINDLFALQKGEAVLDVARSRAKKISKDLGKLEGADVQGVTGLQALLRQAHVFIEDGSADVLEAWDVFAERYIVPLQIKEATSTVEAATSTLERTSTSTSTDRESAFVPTTTPPFASTTVPIVAPLEAGRPEAGVAVASPGRPLTGSTSTLLSGAEEEEVLSIKDLVRISFEDVKDAYRVFIEMSRLVRSLL